MPKIQSPQGFPRFSLIQPISIWNAPEPVDKSVLYFELRIGLDASLHQIAEEDLLSRANSVNAIILS